MRHATSNDSAATTSNEPVNARRLIGNGSRESVARAQRISPRWVHETRRKTRIGALLCSEVQGLCAAPAMRCCRSPLTAHRSPLIMLFNSYVFLFLFLPVTYAIFWSLRSARPRYVWLTVTGYV